MVHRIVIVTLGTKDPAVMEVDHVTDGMKNTPRYWQRYLRAAIAGQVTYVLTVLTGKVHSGHKMEKTIFHTKLVEAVKACQHQFESATFKEDEVVIGAMDRAEITEYLSEVQEIILKNADAWLEATISEKTDILGVNF